MVQRGAIYHCAGHGSTYIPLPMPPRALASGCAKNIWEALGVVPLVNWLFSTVTSKVASMHQQSRLEKRVLPYVVIIVCATVDAASANLNITQHMQQFCLTMAANYARDAGVAVLCVYNLCLAHQVQLAFKSQFARLGGAANNGLCGHRFVSGVIGSTHIFSQSTYFLRIYITAVHILSGLRVLMPIQATVAGHTLADQYTQRHHLVMLRYLLRWALGVSKLSEEHLAATNDIIMILNTRLVSHGDRAGTQCGLESFVHVCSPTCKCGGLSREILVSRLQHATRVVFLRQPQPGSESRWATISPCMAYFGMWLLLHYLGAFALMSSFKRPADASTLEGALSEMLAANVDWQVLYAARLAKCFTFLGHHHTLLHCVIALLVGEPLHIALFSVLRADAQLTPELHRSSA